MEVRDRELVSALKAGDQSAFTELVQQYHASLLRTARFYLHDDHAAEEVVQDAWIAVLTGIDRFEERSSFKTWLFRILVNKARTRWARDRRAVPFSALGGDDPDAPGDPAVDPDRFRPSGRWMGHWAVPPRTRAGLPEERLLAQETLDVAHQAIESLPPRQRQVIVLRDVEGFSSEEVCASLEVSEGNQRVLLHRARSHVRAALEQYFDGEVVV